MMIKFILLPGGRSLEIPHLGLGYLAAITKIAGYKVEILDFSTRKWFESKNGYVANQLNENIENIILFEIEKYLPDILAFSVNVGNFYLSLRLARKIKMKWPESFIVFGGPQATIGYKELIHERSIDVIIMGEGEITFQELLKAKSGYKKFNQINGIIYKENDRVYVNPPQSLIKNLDNLPFPMWNEFNLNNYKFNDNLILPATLSRGCPLLCTFCTVGEVWQNRFRYRNPKLFVDELERNKNDFGTRVFRFNDSTFNFSKKLTNDVCDELIKRELNLIWGCYARIDNIDKFLLDKLFNAGCRYLYFGIESGDQLIINIMNKKLNISNAKKMIKESKKIGLKTLCSFMIGFPGETYETLNQTIKFIEETSPDAVFVFPYETRYNRNTSLLYHGYQIKQRDKSGNIEFNKIREMYTRILPREMVPWDNTNVFFHWEDIVNKSREINNKVSSMGIMQSEYELFNEIFYEEGL